ncbi:MAG TPA: hypothetical protein VHI52_18895 [Verrucomicrobiae bacterium]|nr:hypothetical protein [Verrucomicrobiae bacterium]HWB11761.1 hypothetical protein [Pirellulales bacterium]
MNISDRDVLIGILNAVCAIGEKLTGKKMVVTVTDADGNSVACAHADKVSWVSLEGA